MRTTESDLVEMHVKFWELYAVQMAAKNVDVIAHVPGWLPKIDSMIVEQVSTYAILLHRIPRARVSDIRLTVKAKVVDEFGWKDEPGNVVSVGGVTPERGEDSRRRGFFFREPRCMYTEKTPGYVRLPGGLGLAVLTDGTFRGGKHIGKNGRYPKSNIEKAKSLINCFVIGDINLTSSLLKDSYIQHNLSFATGKKAFLEAVKGLK